MSPGPEKAAPQEGHHDGDRREPGVAFEGESLANVSQIRQLGLTIMFGLVIWLIGLIGAGPQILAAQDQWLKIMPSFPGGAFINGGILVYVSWIVNEGRLLRDEQDLIV